MIFRFLNKRLFVCIKPNVFTLITHKQQNIFSWSIPSMLPQIFRRYYQIFLWSILGVTILGLFPVAYNLLLFLCRQLKIYELQIYIIKFVWIGSVWIIQFHGFNISCRDHYVLASLKRLKSLWHDGLFIISYTPVYLWNKTL